jgi:hypothetical protein
MHRELLANRNSGDHGKALSIGVQLASQYLQLGSQEVVFRPTTFVFTGAYVWISPRFPIRKLWMPSGQEWSDSPIQDRNGDAPDRSDRGPNVGTSFP